MGTHYAVWYVVKEEEIFQVGFIKFCNINVLSNHHHWWNVLLGIIAMVIKEVCFSLCHPVIGWDSDCACPCLVLYVSRKEQKWTERSLCEDECLM